MRYSILKNAAGTLLAVAAIVTAGPGGAQTLESVTVLGPVQSQPLSVTGFTTGALKEAGVTSLSELGQAVPGLRIDSFGPSTMATLRGIGVQTVLGPGVESDVAVYLDGFRQNNLDSLVFDFADIARVDVLKGPQGTQFGQNAIAGAIMLTTIDPTFTTSGRATVSYGAFNDVRLHGYVNVALTNTLAADFSAYRRTTDNYFTDITSGKPSAPIESLSLRGKLLFQPSAASRLVLTAQYADVDDPTSLAYVVGNPMAALYRDAFGVPMTHTTTPLKTSLGRELRNNPRTWSVSLVGNFELGWATLTSRSQFRSERGDARVDLDGTTISYWNLDYRQSDQTITQELNLAGPQEGRLRWRTGFIYSNDLGDLRYYLWQDPFNTGTATPLLHPDIHVKTDSVGLFGSVDYDVMPDLTLTAGARLSHESKAMRSAMLIAPFVPGMGARDWTDLSPRLALSYALDENQRLYASVTQGFKAGNFNFIGVGAQTPVKAERVTQYEAGYKAAGNDWLLNAATYYSRYRDLQTFTFQTACTCFQFSNAPRTEVYGVEAEGQVALDENFSLRAAVAYTHARYREFVGEGPTGAPALPPVYGYATGPINFADKSTIRSPDWTGNVGAMWRMPSTHGTWSAAANLYLTSTVPFTPDHQLKQPGYGLVNLSAGWESPDQKWSVTANGNNVLDQRYQNFSAKGLLGNSIIYGAPASWMLSVERAF